MAAFALLAEYVAINGADITSSVKSATLTLETNALNSETMGDSWEEITAGLKKGSLQLELVDDAADSAIDDDLFAIFGTVVAFEVRPTNASVGANNPKYTGNVFIAQHAIGGQHGDLAKKSLTFPTSGAVSRAEA